MRSSFPAAQVRREGAGAQFSDARLGFPAGRLGAGEFGHQAGGAGEMVTLNRAGNGCIVWCGRSCRVPAATSVAVLLHS
jgi:hypothetical protein